MSSYCRDLFKCRAKARLFLAHSMQYLYQSDEHDASQRGRKIYTDTWGYRVQGLDNTYSPKSAWKPQTGATKRPCPVDGAHILCVSMLVGGEYRSRFDISPLGTSGCRCDFPSPLQITNFPKLISTPLELQDLPLTSIVAPGRDGPQSVPKP